MQFICAMIAFWMFMSTFILFMGCCDGFISSTFASPYHSTIDRVSTQQTLFSHRFPTKVFSEEVNSRRAFVNGFISCVMAGVTVTDMLHPKESRAYDVFDVSEEALEKLNNQEKGTKALLDSEKLFERSETSLVLNYGSKEYDDATKIMKRFNKSMDEYWKGSWEVVNLDSNVQTNIEFDANVFSKKNSETRIQRLNVQSYLPDKYRRKLSSELSGFLHR